MITQIKTWGNSQGIRLSKELLETANMHVDDSISVKVENDRIILSKQFVHKTLEERIKESGKPLEVVRGIDYGEARGREIW